MSTSDLVPLIQWGKPKSKRHVKQTNWARTLLKHGLQDSPEQDWSPGRTLRSWGKNLPLWVLRRQWVCVRETKSIWSHSDPSWCSSTLFTDYMDPTMSPNLSGSYCPFIGLDKGTNLPFSLTVQTMLHYYTQKQIKYSNHICIWMHMWNICA